MASEYEHNQIQADLALNIARETKALDNAKYNLGYWLKVRAGYHMLSTLSLWVRFPGMEKIYDMKPLKAYVKRLHK